MYMADSDQKPGVSSIPVSITGMFEFHNGGIRAYPGSGYTLDMLLSINTQTGMVCIACDEFCSILNPTATSFVYVFTASVAVQPPFNLISTLIELLN